MRRARRNFCQVASPGVRWDGGAYSFADLGAGIASVFVGDSQFLGCERVGPGLVSAGSGGGEESGEHTSRGVGERFFLGFCASLAPLGFPAAPNASVGMFGPCVVLALLDFLGLAPKSLGFLVSHSSSGVPLRLEEVDKVALGGGSASARALTDLVAEL